MFEFYTPETFNQDKYQKTGWRVNLVNAKFDNGKDRLIVNVATGRKYWCIFSEVVEFNLGVSDPAIKFISAALKSYTHPMVERFIEELEIMLLDLYKVEIKLEIPEYINYLKQNKK